MKSINLKRESFVTILDLSKKFKRNMEELNEQYY